MERRRVLGAVGAVLVATSVPGCGDASNPPSGSTDPPTDPGGDGGELTDDEPTEATTNADKRFEPRFGTAGSDTPTAALEAYFNRFPEGRKRVAETIHPNSTLGRSFFLDNWYLDRADSASVTATLIQKNPSYSDIEEFSSFLDREYEIPYRYLQEVYELIRDRNQTALVSAGVTIDISGERGDDIERYYEDAVQYAIVATHEGSWFLVDLIRYRPRNN